MNDQNSGTVGMGSLPLLEGWWLDPSAQNGAVLLIGHHHDEVSWIVLLIHEAKRLLHHDTSIHSPGWSCSPCGDARHIGGDQKERDCKFSPWNECPGHDWDALSYGLRFRTHRHIHLSLHLSTTSPDLSPLIAAWSMVKWWSMANLWLMDGSQWCVNISQWWSSGGSMGSQWVMNAW